MFEKEAEEMAEAWLDEKYLKDMGVRKPCKEAFLAGFKVAKQEKWHNLKNNPKDLPEPHSTVLDENGDKITYRGGDIWTVYSDYYEKGIDSEPPKAWCEIPKFIDKE